MVKSNALGPKVHMYGPREIHNYILPRIHKANGQSPTANQPSQSIKTPKPIAQSIKPSINQAINQSSHQSTRPIGHKAPKPTGRQDESIKLPSPKSPHPRTPIYQYVNKPSPKKRKEQHPQEQLFTARTAANGITSGQRHYLRPTALPQANGNYLRRGQFRAMDSRI